MAELNSQILYQLSFSTLHSLLSEKINKQHGESRNHAAFLLINFKHKKARSGVNRAIHIRDCVLCFNALQVVQSPVTGFEPVHRYMLALTS